ncbi:MAG: penicillin-binding protein 1C [Gammaproteobacteria bacterium]|nr:penicillin-binding protein 1C [Gammaproteobacteria bacterium]
MNSKFKLSKALIMRKKIAAGSIIALSVWFIWETWAAQRPFPDTLSFENSAVRKIQVLDRNGVPLTITYQNRWNIHDYVPLHRIPRALQQIFLLAEDKRFYSHSGVDWRARIHAMQQNIMAGRVVRGASTITEQCVRMVHPRPRTFWSRWVETFEAARLEQRFSKAAILEFYLNQVPYAHQRRGVVQAARHYFDRDLDTLNTKEMLATAILVRSPSRLDLRRGTAEIQKPLAWLLERMLKPGMISRAEYKALLAEPLHLKERSMPLQASHFVNYIYRTHTPASREEADFSPADAEKILFDPPLSKEGIDKSIPARGGRLRTTLDASIQRRTQAILDKRLRDLYARGVNNGAALIVDHGAGHVLAWVNTNADPKDPENEMSGSQIDAVTAPRQPGSTLKPFLYALALEKGWTAATLIDDSPLSASVGVGMHTYRNYSRGYYGPLRLRDALGNSLNIPAVRTVQFVGIGQFLERLKRLGVENLSAHPDFYGDGLALGNGELTLFELVQAYAALANQGMFRPLKVLKTAETAVPVRVFSEEVSSIIANILSDPDARRLEFGRGTLLRFPVQTAVKTGTSNDYRDAWAVGFNHRYTIGVWLGNLDRQPMAQISGAAGPALVLRTLFAELNRYEETRPLYLSPKLKKAEICRATGLSTTPDCASRMEFFRLSSKFFSASSEHSDTPSAGPARTLRLRQPTEGLQLAMDPRIPDEHEAFSLALPQNLKSNKVEWLVDGEVAAVTANNENRYLWPLSRGVHTAQARVWEANSARPRETRLVTFYVK